MASVELNTTMIRNFPDYQLFPWKDACYYAPTGTWYQPPPMTEPYFSDGGYHLCMLSSVKSPDIFSHNSSLVKYWHSGFYAPDHYRSTALLNVTVVGKFLLIVTINFIPTRTKDTFLLSIY